MTEINFQNFKAEISDSDKPVLLFFYNTDTTAIDDMDNTSLKETVKLCKANIEGGGAVFASLYGILSVPTVLLLKSGKEIARYSRELEEDTLQEFLRNNL